MRKCGGCTLCCRLPAVTELDKPGDTWCEHCAIGTGCTVYKQRPQGCRDFECLWLANPAIPDEARPDRIGVVFEAFRTSRTCLAMVDPDRPYAWEGPEALGIIGNLLKHDVAVLISMGGKIRYVLAPKGRSMDEVDEDMARELAIH